MFTGLIQDIGKITALEKTARDATLTIQTGLPLSSFALGASIACDGICLTLIEKSANTFKVQLSGETLDKTTAKEWALGREINLEPSLKLGDELGGHLVSGHVDGVGECLAVKQDGDGWRYQFKVSETLAPFIAAKGSVTINGISLTVNDVAGECFDVMIIPHTFNHTTIKHVKAGSGVNIEIDILARYVARLQQYKAI